MLTDAVREALLSNVPNIPRFGVTIDVNGMRATGGSIRFEGEMYRTAMYYVVHTECGTRILALISRAVYNKPPKAFGVSEVRKPLLTYCPHCRAQVGKHARDQLLTQGKLHNYHSAGVDVDRSIVAAYYTFPRGVGYSLLGEITSIDPEWVTPMNLAYDPDEDVEPEDWGN